MSLAASAFALICTLGAPEVVVTIDDLPLVTSATSTAERSRITDALLATLKKHDIKAVGFVTWDRTQGAAGVELLERWLDAGHELGNHSKSHLSYTHTDIETYLADIEEGRRQVAAVLKKRGLVGPEWFRFPYLREGDTLSKLQTMRAYLKKTRQQNLPVTIDVQDWNFEEPWREGKNRKEVAENYQHHLRQAIRHHTNTSKKLFGRDVPQVLLLHANTVGSAQWDELFTWMKSEGYRFVHVSRVVRDKAYQEQHEFVGPYGYSRWDRLKVVRRDAAAKASLRKIIKKQAKDWNKGDLKAFTDVYADDATFVTRQGIQRGRAQILARYKQKYPSAVVRGRLRFEVKETRLMQGYEVTRDLDAVPGRIQGASTVLRWIITPLEGVGKTKSGYSLITWKSTVHGWRIEQDASM